VDKGSIGVILNPAAAGGKTIKLMPEIVEQFGKCGRQHDIYVTSHAGETPVVARQMLDQGHHTLVAVGGDGTINEVASVLLEQASPCALGIIPSGSGSDFVRTLRLPKDLVQAVQVVVNRRTERIDAGQITFDDGSTKYFVNVAGLGFDAVVAEFALTSHMPGSTMPYLVSAVRAMRVYKNMSMRIESAERIFEGRAASVLFANARYFAGGMHIAPMASITDGKLDVAILGDLSPAEMLRAVPSVFRGKHVTNPKFSHFTTTSLRVSTERPARVQADGELMEYTPVTIDVLPGALQICR
jgi:YegS/Rv2252/BmrU family lipid kinase